VSGHFLAPNRDFRWQGPLALIGEMRRSPGITRAQAARNLGMSSGLASDIVARLRGLALIDETPAPAARRGRPTRVLSRHPDGPVVLAIDIQQRGWRSACAGLDGEPEPLSAGAHKGPPLENTWPERVLPRVREEIEAARLRFGHRLRVVSVSVAGTVRDGLVVDSPVLGWNRADLAGLVPADDLPLVAGNDATLAGLAEARSGAAQDARVCLHLSIEVGIGGVLVVDHAPVTGATGTGGEFGHLPFGDPALECPCGARGCWDLDVDGRALARHLGDPAPADPRDYALDVLGRVPHDERARCAAGLVASALGRGIAGLVNASDPEVVTLGGLGGRLIAAAPGEFSSAYQRGLMRYRHAASPAVVPAAYSEDGAPRGALAAGLDVVLTEDGLSAWAAEHAG
jgi:predicted NBD/HSP70 family sugar kinase